MTAAAISPGDRRREVGEAAEEEELGSEPDPEPEPEPDPDEPLPELALELAKELETEFEPEPDTALAVVAGITPVPPPLALDVVRAPARSVESIPEDLGLADAVGERPPADITVTVPEVVMV
jgi:hypothetical protein